MNAVLRAKSRLNVRGDFFDGRIERWIDVLILEMGSR